MMPNKSNFKFQELTPITGVKPYVIRFWETEFPEISPISSEKGEKIYARKDVEAILRIKKFLFEDKLSIPEARAKMSVSYSEEMVGEITEDGLSLAAGADAKDELRPVIQGAMDLIKEIKAKRSW